MQIIIIPAQAAITIVQPYLKLSGFLQRYEIAGGNHFNVNHRGQFRRARLFITGQYKKKITYRIEYDFSGHANWKNVWVNYKTTINNIRIGQFKMPFNSIFNQNAQFNWFNEWALPVRSFRPGFRKGVSYHFIQPIWNAGVSFFMPGIQSQSSFKYPYGSTQRFLYYPINNTGKTLQFGLSNWYQRTNKTNRVNYRSIPEASGYIIINTLQTGRINNVNNFDVVALEGLFQYQKFASQLGLLYDITPRTNASTLYFYGWYSQFSYFLNKNTLKYNPLLGVFTSPQQMKLTYQLVFRISGLSLNHHEIKGGEGVNLSLGLNTYFLSHVKLAFNYIYTSVHKSIRTVNGHDNIFLANLQIML